MSFYLQQHHTFYPRRGRQRCTVWHVMALYNVHPLFTICHIPGTIPDFVLLLRNCLKIENSPAILCPTRGSNPRPFAQQSHLRPTVHL
ncbi:hypothetical protein SFRURICE_013693 [Spodoptera frugiperda]|nr:hypothetical protein SFRURICE_013693 [Spodoptera frugiperda]